MRKTQRDRSSFGVPSAAFDIVVIGASLGGLAALSQLLSALPADFPVPIVVVQHLHARFPSQLPLLLDRSVPLRVKQAEDGERLRPATVYVAPSNRHLLIDQNRTLTLSYAPKVEFARPSVNVLFASVAASIGERAIGIVLTGRLRDGAAGAQAIKQRGGRVLVQDRETSAAFGMPQAAIATGCVDFVLPIPKIACALVSLVMVRGAASWFKVFTPPPTYPQISG